METKLQGRSFKFFESLSNKNVMSTNDSTFIRKSAVEKLYRPCEPRVNGMSYVSLNSFFRRRVVPDYAQDIREYLDAIGLAHYDFEEPSGLFLGKVP